MLLLRSALVVALAVHTAAQGVVRDSQLADAEMKLGFSHLKRHVKTFRDDLQHWFTDRSARQGIKSDLSGEIHKLRKAFDRADAEIENGTADPDKLAHDLAQDFASMDRVKIVKQGHNKAARQAGHRQKKFDRAHWEELKEAFHTGRPKRHVPGKTERMAKAAQKARERVQLQSAHHAHHEYHEIVEVPYVVGRDQCGAKISAHSMGLRRSANAARAFQSPALLQASPPDPSWAQPGAGMEQEVADGGAMGTVQDHSGELIEPFVKVYKDGYSLSTCAADAMFSYADKYSNNKDKFGKEAGGVSIVVYKEIVEESDAKAMSPEVCFDFCKTVPDMVFFGLVEGRTCYCTPYWKPSAEGSGACDLPCEGSSGEMCGGQDKSSIYEMHMCADTAGDLFRAANSAALVLQYFYENADQLKHYDETALKSGQTMQKVGGLGGDPIASAMGMEAMKSSGTAAKLLQDGTCIQAYQELIEVYDEGDSIKELDFSQAKLLEKADTAIQKMKELTPTVEGCAKKGEDFNSLAYMFWVPFAESLGGEDGGSAWWGTHMDKCTASSQGYKPLVYMMDSQSDAKMSTCSGTIIGVPMLMHYAECAEACEQTVYPDKCVGFQHFSFQGKDGEKPLCYMFKDFDAINMYTCEWFTYDDKFWNTGAAAALPQVTSGTQQLRGGANHTLAAGVNCEAIAESIFYRGRKCYPKEKAACPELCDLTKGAKISASCMASVASLGATDKIKKTEFNRCFGKDENGEDSSDGEEEMPLNADFGGEHKFGAATLTEPTVWTD